MDASLVILIFLLMFSLILLLIWTLGAQSSASKWVSVSISIHRQIKVLALLSISNLQEDNYMIFFGFIAALFVIARTWKQPRCSSIEEWLKKVWNIYTLEFYSAVKNNDILNFACHHRTFIWRWMEIETETHIGTLDLTP